MELNAKVPPGPLADKWERHQFDLKLVNPANKRKFTVIVVGSGLAGASAAASMSELGYKVHEAGHGPEKHRARDMRQREHLAVGEVKPHRRDLAGQLELREPLEIVRQPVNRNGLDLGLRLERRSGHEPERKREQQRRGQGDREKDGIAQQKAATRPEVNRHGGRA